MRVEWSRDGRLSLHGVLVGLHSSESGINVTVLSNPVHLTCVPSRKPRRWFSPRLQPKIVRLNFSASFICAEYIIGTSRIVSLLDHSALLLAPQLFSGNLKRHSYCKRKLESTGQMENPDAARGTESRTKFSYCSPSRSMRMI
jgi:hypothetical protein